MAKTPYNSLSSTDILSAHINGLASGVNNLETALNMKTTTANGQAMSAVNDMTDNTLKNRIYECAIRNWTSFTIKRDGVTVDPSEYVAHGGFGAVVFNVSQGSAVITADITYITTRSNFLDSIKNLNTMHLSGHYASHGMTGGSLGSAVGTLGNTPDAFPFIVLETTVYDRMMVEQGTTIVGTKCKMAVYADNGNFFPGSLIVQTLEADMTTAGQKVVAFEGGDLTLQPGLYWLARWSDGACNINSGLDGRSAYSLGLTDASITNYLTGANYAMPGGVRSTAVTYNGTFPSTFPTLAGGSKYLARVNYGSPWIRKK